MSAIVSIGALHVMLPTAAIAAAVKEALENGARMEGKPDDDGNTAWRVSTSPMPPIGIRLADADAVVNGTPLTITPTVEALLNKSPRERRRIQRVLTEESIRLRKEAA